MSGTSKFPSKLSLIVSGGLEEAVKERMGLRKFYKDKQLIKI